MDTEAAQPEEGQGAEATGAGNDLYSSFLADVPEEYHEHVIPALKAQDAEVTKRFQARAEQTKPFEELGIFDMEPDEVGAYLHLDQAMQAAQEGDEQAAETVYEWWDQVGEALGFYGDDSDDEDGDDENEDFDILDLDKNKLAELLQSEVQQAVGPLAEHLQSKEQAEREQAAMAEAHQQIDSWVDELKGAHPNVFGGEDGDKVMDEVLELAELFAEEENPVQAAFDKYQSLVGKGESNLFAQKASQPKAPEGAGPTAPDAPTPTMKNARDMALAYIQNQKQMT